MLLEYRKSHVVQQISPGFAIAMVLAIAVILFPATLQAQGKKGGGGGGGTPPIQFTMELITTPSGSPDFGRDLGAPRDINEAGFVVGTAGADSPATYNAHAFLWTPTTRMIDLNTMLGAEDQLVWTLKEAWSINDFNVICGDGYNAVAGAMRGFRFDLNTGIIEELETPTGFRSRALDVNNFGECAGFLYSSSIAGYWSANNEFVFLPTLPARPNGQALAINDSGNMVGYSSGTGTGNNLALLWPSALAAPIDIGYIALGKDNVPDAEAKSVNDVGEVVGRSSAGKYKSGPTWFTIYHAFLRTPGQGMTDLGTFGGRNSDAVAINNRRDVVGYADTTNNLGSEAAFFYSNGTGMVNLRTAITNLPSNMETFRYVFSINESREIVGNCSFKNDSRVWSLILRPVNQ